MLAPMEDDTTKFRGTCTTATWYTWALGLGTLSTLYLEIHGVCTQTSWKQAPDTSWEILNDFESATMCGKFNSCEFKWSGEPRRYTRWPMQGWGYRKVLRYMYKCTWFTLVSGLGCLHITGETQCMYTHAESSILRIPKKHWKAMHHQSQVESSMFAHSYTKREANTKGM